MSYYEIDYSLLVFKRRSIIYDLGKTKEKLCDFACKHVIVAASKYETVTAIVTTLISLSNILPRWMAVILCGKRH